MTHSEEGKMSENKGFQLGTIGALTLSVVSSVSIVICNKALMSTLHFIFGKPFVRILIIKFSFADFMRLTVSNLGMACVEVDFYCNYIDYILFRLDMPFFPQI